MADFLPTQTDNTSVNDSILSVWNTQTLFEAAPEMIVTQLATTKVVAGAAKSAWYSLYAFVLTKLTFWPGTSR